MKPIIGIDLGTTFSVVACFEGSEARVIRSAEGKPLFPSVVHFKEGGEVVVGELARRQLVISPLSTIHSAKRFMGKKFSELTEDEQTVAYPLEADEQGWLVMPVGEKQYRPEDISALVLQKLKGDAELFLQEEVSEAVVTVPAYFNDTQRQMTKRAGERAGLQLLRIINEPTAASLAYGLGKGKREKVAVFDFGGGTFDISLLDIQEDVFEVLASAGNNTLGGRDIDELLTRHICGRLRETLGVELEEDLGVLQRIREAAEQAKCELSFTQSTQISLPYLTEKERQPVHFQEELSREQLEKLIAPMLDELQGPCRQALRDAGLVAAQIDRLILVGGSTRIPAVRELAQRLFDKEPLGTIDPDEVVAQGAAIQAAIIKGSVREVLLVDVTPFSLGVETESDRFSVVIPRNSSIPTVASKRFTTTSDYQTTVYIHILQGESLKASGNSSLGYFRLFGIPSAPSGMAEIDVRFQIDANGILNVAAQEISSGMAKEVSIETYQELLSEEALRQTKLAKGEETPQEVSSGEEGTLELEIEEKELDSIDEE